MDDFIRLCCDYPCVCLMYLLVTRGNPVWCVIMRLTKQKRELVDDEGENEDKQNTHQVHHFGDGHFAHLCSSTGPRVGTLETVLGTATASEQKTPGKSRVPPELRLGSELGRQLVIIQDRVALYGVPGWLEIPPPRLLVFGSDVFAHVLLWRKPDFSLTHFSKPPRLCLRHRQNASRGWLDKADECQARPDDRREHVLVQVDWIRLLLQNDLSYFVFKKWQVNAIAGARDDVVHLGWAVVSERDLIAWNSERKKSRVEEANQIRESWWNSSDVKDHNYHKFAIRFQT